MPYDFTRSVQDPRDIYPQGYGATQDSTAAVVGTALSGIANIFDMGIKAAAENKLDKRLGDFENEIDPYVQAVGQGRMTSNDAMARTTAKIKTYIDRYPHLADDFRKRAQDIWGVNPSSELLKNAQDKEAVERKRQQDIDNHNLGVANEFGAIPTDEQTGQPDYKVGIEVGREISGYMANLDAAIKEVNLKRAQAELNGKGGETWDEQRKRLNVEISGQAAAITLANIDAHITKIPSIQKQLGNPSDAKGLQHAQQVVDESYYTTYNAVNRMLLQHPDLDTQTRHDILEQVTEAYAGYRGKSLNTISQASNILTQQGNITRTVARETMPQTMAMVDILGQAGASIPARQWGLALTKTGANRRSSMQQEFGSFMDKINSINNGVLPPSDPTNREMDTALANSSKGIVDEAAKNPKTTPDQGLPAVGNHLQFTISKALESDDPDDYMAALGTANNAGTAQVLERLKAQNPDQYEAAVNQILQLNMNAIERLSNEAGRSVEAAGKPVADYEGLLALGIPAGAPTANLSLQYNATTGVVEPVGIRTGVKVPERLYRLQQALNSSLRTLVRYKEQGLPDDLTGLSDQELKLFFMQSHGIQIKGKTPEQAEEDAKAAKKVKIKVKE